MILCYSGCGNSRFVAGQLAQHIADQVVTIDLKETSPTITLADNEPLGIVCPVYAWRIPRVVESYMSRLHSNATPPYCYLVCTCGDNAGFADKRFAKLLRLKGWHLHAAFSVVMPETYVNLKPFNLDTPASAQKKTDNAREYLSTIAAHISHRDSLFNMERGILPAIKSGIVNTLFYKFLITDKRFVVHNNCIGCGICEQNCPLGNITLVDGRPHWHGNCTNCMSCYHRCPTNAIHFGTTTTNKGQYYFGKENR